jgi:hypothetical protein
MHEGDWRQVYTFFDEESRKQCGLEQFLTAGERAAGFLTGLSMDVTHIAVEGDTATAEVMVTPSWGEATANTWELVREDGEWRLRWDVSAWCAVPNNGETPGP